MAKLIFNIPDDKVDLIVDGWCNRYEYKDSIFELDLDEDGNTINDSNGDPKVVQVPNPQTKISFVKEKIRLMIKVEAIRGIGQDRERAMNELLSLDRSDINSVDIT